MKSKFFQRTTLSDDGKKHLETVAKTPAPKLEQIFEWFIGRDVHPRFDDDDIIELSQLTGLSGDEVTDIVPILRHFLTLVYYEEEDPNALYDDIKDSGFIDESIGFDNLDFVFTKLPDIAKQYRPLARKSATELAGSPSLKSSSMSVAVKPVYKRRFDYGKDSLEKYRPELIDYCLVAQVEIERTDSAESFHFQCNKDVFDRFVSDLLALQAEMAQMGKVIEDLKTT